MARAGQLAVLLAAMLLTACSQHQVYDSVQSNRQLECQKQPQSQYESCMQSVSEPYESYRRQREQDRQAK